MDTLWEIEWVKADEERPEELTTVLVYTAFGVVTLGTVYEGRWEIDFPRWGGPGGQEVMGADVVYWTYVPYPPLHML